MIIVPYDFSNKASFALEQAMYLADASNMPLEIVHISNKAAEREYPRKWNYTKYDRFYLEDKLKHIAIQRMHKLHLSKALDFSCYITESVLVGGAIIKRALTTKAKLIVMGTHGFSGAKEVLLGSNTSSIINQAIIPVLAVPRVWKPKPIKQLIVASESDQIKVRTKVAQQWASLLKCNLDWVEFYYLPDKSQIKKIKAEFPEHTLIRANVANSLAQNLVSYTSRKKESALMMFVHQRNILQKIFNSSITEHVSGLIRIPLLAIPVKK
jgi:nucleotide-binding universal stress UspA family protein